MPLTDLLSALQSFSAQTEDCNDSSVVDSCDFIPDGVAGQSQSRQTGDKSSVNNLLTKLCINLFFFHRSEGVFEKFTVYKTEENPWEEEICKWQWRLKIVHDTNVKVQALLGMHLTLFYICS